MRLDELSSQSIETGSSRSAARRSFALAFISTLLAAAAQILVKRGASSLQQHATLTQVLQQPSLFFYFAISVVTNLNLFVGYALSGINVVVLSLALKGQDLSRIYPVISLAFVWVTVFSLLALPGEHLNFYRVAGITTIVIGVSILGLKR